MQYLSSEKNPTSIPTANLRLNESASVTVDRGINTKKSSNFPFKDSMQFLFPYLVS